VLRTCRGRDTLIRVNEPGPAGGHAPSRHARDLSRFAKQVYVDGPLIGRKFQHWRPFISPFERLLPIVPVGSRVLDIGCGAGLLLGLLAQAGRLESGIGIDASASAIALANRMRDRLARTDAAAAARLEFRRLDVSEPWPTGPFDVVSIVDVMHHVPPAHWRSLVASLAAHVAPAGMLLYKDMCRRPRWRAFANRMHDLLVARQRIHYAPVESIETWAAEEGLQLTQSEQMNRLCYGHELRVFIRPPSAQNSAQ
jgi:2-polyprenyl-3-methyl-5-hydroxy-6-metoxy-1,4-benzoquinol methylase